MLQHGHVAPAEGAVRVGEDRRQGVEVEVRDRVALHGARPEAAEVTVRPQAAAVVVPPEPQVRGQGAALQVAGLHSQAPPYPHT